MKMADGGYRPAYNAQFATDTERQVIVGVEAATAGSDMGQLMPMLEQVGERCGQDPDAWLVDGGYPAHEQIEQAAERTDVYAPVPKPKDPATDPHARKDGDSDAIATWVSAWAAGRPRPSTRRVPPPPSASTPWRASVACRAYGCVVRPRYAACCCCMRWRTA